MFQFLTFLLFSVIVAAFVILNLPPEDHDDTDV